MICSDGVAFHDNCVVFSRLNPLYAARTRDTYEVASKPSVAKSDPLFSRPRFVHNRVLTWLHIECALGAGVFTRWLSRN